MEKSCYIGCENSARIAPGNDLYYPVVIDNILGRLAGGV